MSITHEPSVASSNDAPVDGLRRNRNFKNLWIAESISQVGSQISIVALPLLAILTLDASPSQMGLLTAAGTAPFLLIGLFVGVWVDRVRRRPLLIAADIARGAILMTLPVAWWLEILRIEMLYGVALLTGALTVIFDVSWLTFLPSVVRRSQLVEANSKLQVSASVAQVSGPGAGGLIISAVGAPIAILLDALSFLCSAAFVQRVSAVEKDDDAAVVRRSVRQEIVEGLNFVYQDRVLRALASSKVVLTFSAGVFFPAYLLFMAEDLGLGATAIGLVLATGGVGALIGAWLSDRLSNRAEPGQSVVGGQLLFGVFGVTIPLAVFFPALALIMVVLSELLQWLTHTIAQVNELAIRQASVPDRYLGRVNSVFQFFGRGMTPLGALTGGVLGEFIGIPATLVAASIGFFAAFLFVFFSPVRNFAAIVDDNPDSAALDVL